MNVRGRIQVSALINPATPNRTARITFAHRRQLPGFFLLRRAQEACDAQDPQDCLVPGFQRGAFTGRGDAGWRGRLRGRQGAARCVHVNAAQDDEVSGDAGDRPGRAHIAPAHAGGTAPRPCNRPVDPSRADRASALPIGEHRRGAIRCTVARSLRPLARRRRADRLCRSSGARGCGVDRAWRAAPVRRGRECWFAPVPSAPTVQPSPPPRRRRARPADRQARCSSGLASSSCTLAPGHRLTSPATSVTRNTWRSASANTARI